MSRKTGHIFEKRVEVINSIVAKIEIAENIHLQMMIVFAILTFVIIEKSDSNI